LGWKKELSLPKILIEASSPFEDLDFLIIGEKIYIEIYEGEFE